MQDVRLRDIMPPRGRLMTKEEYSRYVRLRIDALVEEERLGGDDAAELKEKLLIESC